MNATDADLRYVEMGKACAKPIFLQARRSLIELFDSPDAAAQSPRTVSAVSRIQSLLQNLDQYRDDPREGRRYWAIRQAGVMLRGLSSGSFLGEKLLEAITQLMDGGIGTAHPAVHD